MRRTRLAVIGLGMASAPHARSLADLADRVEVAAVYSPNAERRNAFAAEHGFPAADSLEAVLGDPPSRRCWCSLRPAAIWSWFGKHILLEKPLETSLSRAEALVETAETAAVTLAVVLQHRFRPVGEALVKAVRDGRLGALVGASARLANWRPQSYYDQPGRGTRARDGGGVLLTQAIHTLDLMIAAAGLPAEATGYVATSPVHRMETEDLAFAALRFPGGALGGIAATTAAFPGFDDAVEVIGSAGTARLDGTTLTLHLHDGTEETLTDASPGGGAGADPMAFAHDHHRRVLADFLDAVSENRPPRVDGREALKVHRLIDAILRSAESGNREAV
jgi:UDP-N-acetyl-2-amino-2-deoxyglucuronate dehydrogenase